MSNKNANPNPFLRRALCVAFFCAFVFLSFGAAAQTSDPPATTTPRSGTAGLEEITSGTSLIYKDPDTGEIRRLGEVSAEMLQQLQERILLQQGIETFNIQQLEIDAQITGNLVHLTADIQIDVYAEGEWVEVPVGFEEFQLTQLQHSSKVPDSRATLKKSALPLKNWLLYGKGTHELSLKLIGATRVSQNGRRRLKLDAPKASISHLLLDLGDRVESAELSSERPFKLLTQDRTSLLETWGLSPATEVTWTPALSQTAARVTVQAPAPATMELDLSTSSLIVTQRLTITGGSVDHLNVQLPSGFGNVSISGRNADDEEIVIPTEPPADGSTQVEFTSPVTGPITLHYDFAMKNTPGPEELSIRLPDVREVANESGDLEVFVPVGLDVEVDTPDVRHVRQRRVESNRGVRTAVVAYRMLSEKSVLKLKVRATEAFFSVIPQISFEAERSNILMTARFSINMVRGSLNQIEIVWPDYADDEWKILHEYTRMIDGESSTPLTGFDVEARTLTLPQLMSGQFEIELQAFRPRNAADGEGMLLYLPDIRSPAPHTTLVSLIDSDSFSMSLTSPNDQSTFPLLPASRWPERLKQRGQPMTVRRVDSASDAVELNVTAQRPEVKVSVHSELSALQGSIVVSQVMNFDVRHRDLAEIKVAVAGVNPRLRLGDSTAPLERLEVDGNNITYGLPDPVRGEFQIHLDYFWSPDVDEGSVIELPLVLPSSEDQELTETTIGTNVPETLFLSTETAWERVYSSDFAAAWSTVERQETVTVELRHSIHSTITNSPRFVVLKSVVRGSDLVTSITAVYSKTVKSAMFTLPDSVMEWEGFIGGQQTSSIDVITEDPDLGRIVQIRADTALDTPGSAVTATLIVSQPIAKQSHLLSIWRPQLPQVTGASSDGNAIWLLAQTPEDSVVYCGGQMAEVGSILQSRLSGGSGAAIREELTALLSPYHGQVRSAVMELTDKSGAESGNCQILAGSLSGDPPVLVSISRRITLLITAIVGLLTYLAFLKLRAISLTTVVVLVGISATIIVALIPGPGQLILIRLAPGCVIAVVAAVLQRAFGRTRVSPSLTVRDYDQSTIFTTEQPAGASFAVGGADGRSPDIDSTQLAAP